MSLNKKASHIDKLSIRIYDNPTLRKTLAKLAKKEGLKLGRFVQKLLEQEVEKLTKKNSVEKILGEREGTMVFLSGLLSCGAFLFLFSLFAGYSVLTEALLFPLFYYSLFCFLYVGKKFLPKTKRKINRLFLKLDKKLYALESYEPACLQAVETSLGKIYKMDKSFDWKKGKKDVTIRCPEGTKPFVIYLSYIPYIIVIES